MGVWVGEFARGAEFGAVEWVMPSRTLQIVCSGRFTLPLGRAPPSYPPTPTLLPLPPSFRRTPGPMVADRVMMGDIIGSTVTVGPGVRRDDGRGWVGLCGWTGRGRTANGRTGELANCELRTANCANIHPPDRTQPLPPASTFAASPASSTLALQRREGAGGLPPTPSRTYFTRRCKALLGRTGAKPLSSDGAGAPPAGHALWIHI